MSTPSPETHLPTVELTDPNGTAEVEAHAQRIGLPMLDFALGTDRDDTDEAVDDQWAQLDDDDADTDGEDLDAEVLADGSPVEQLAPAAAENPRRYQRWARHRVETMPALTATGHHVRAEPRGVRPDGHDHGVRPGDRAIAVGGRC